MRIELGLDRVEGDDEFPLLGEEGEGREYDERRYERGAPLLLEHDHCRSLNRYA